MAKSKTKKLSMVQFVKAYLEIAAKGGSSQDLAATTGMRKNTINARVHILNLRLMAAGKPRLPPLRRSSSSLSLDVIESMILKKVTEDD